MVRLYRKLQKASSGPNEFSFLSIALALAVIAALLWAPPPIIRTASAASGNCPLTGNAETDCNGQCCGTQCIDNTMYCCDGAPCAIPCMAGQCCAEGQVICNGTCCTPPCCADKYGAPTCGAQCGTVCFQCDDDGNGKNDDCFQCPTGAPTSCLVCDNNQDGVMDGCYVCDFNGDGTADSCFNCYINDVLAGCASKMTSWSELQSCTVLKQAIPPSSNGCGTASLPFPPDPCNAGTNPSTSFLACCNAHDIAWSTCGTSQGNAASAFSACMDAVCDAARNPTCPASVWTRLLGNTCQGMADSYYTSVSGQTTAYQTSQLGVCGCCDG